MKASKVGSLPDPGTSTSIVFARWSWFWLLCLATVASSSAQSFKTVASFDVGNGAEPQFMSLVQAGDGNLYGTTRQGGPNLSGTVFTISPAGELTTLCYFSEDTCYQEWLPFSGLFLASDGNFYGTTWQGGQSGLGGAGTVYRTGPGVNDVTLLYSFCAQTNCADGGDPFAPVMQATDGTLYGTTFNGGAQGYGIAYAITTSGTFTALHSFRYADGAGPVAGLIQAKDGNFYGTTLYGGAHDAGTVFSITPAGKLKTLHSFGAAGDGASPYAALVQASDGNFYGTTRDGGTHGHGAVFRITPSGKLTTLHSFCSQKKCADGASPYAGLIQASDGNLYGTASKGGAGNWGTLYAITLAGQLTTLYSFCGKKNCVDGADPLGGLLQASDGNLYGTTAEGGIYGEGTVFSLSLAIDQVAETLPPSAGTAVGTSAPNNFPSHGSDRRPLRRQLPQPDPSAHAPASIQKPGGFNCSPAPCVLPPTQASEGGGIVTDSVIVTDPTSQKELLLGSFDANCPSPSALGFHLSRDGGSTWNRVLCMLSLNKNGRYDAAEEPAVAYDHDGNAFAVGVYFGNFANGAKPDGFLAMQKSTNGSTWNKPVIALIGPGHTYPFETSLAVDVNPSSPWVNSVYVSGVMWSHQGRQNQIMVSHSSDGGKTWKQTAVDAVQKDPDGDSYTRITVGKDGTAYVAWLHCSRNKESGICSTAQMMFSKSTDGGKTWSTPQRTVTIQLPYGLLPNSHGERVYNYPVIAADNSNGPYSGNLYVAMYTWNGTHLQAQVIRSSDGGKTWSKPVPVAPPTDTHDQFFPTISVSPTGLVGVSWLDRRNDSGDLNYQAFAAISSDGGKSFGHNWQLTKAFSDPDVNGTLNRWMGDYTGNTWDGNKFIAAWMDSSNGVDMQEVVGGVRLK